MDKDNLQKNTPSRLGEMVILSNAQKPTQRVKQDEEAEEYVPNERTQ